MNRKLYFIEWMHKIGSVYQSDYEIDIALARVDETYAPVLPSGIKQNNAYASKRKSVQRNESLLKNSQR